MDQNKIDSALHQALDELDAIDVPFRIFSVFVHLTRDFSEPELNVIARLRESDDILNPKVYTSRLLGLEITKKGVEELVQEEWVAVIKLLTKKRLM